MMDVNELIQLAEEFGLPCIERDGHVSIVGLEQIIECYFEFGFINLEEILYD
jgi:hypothetical protein